GVNAAATRHARSVSILVSDASFTAPSGWTCRSVSWQISILLLYSGTFSSACSTLALLSTSAGCEPCDRGLQGRPAGSHASHDVLQRQMMWVKNRFCIDESLPFRRWAQLNCLNFAGLFQMRPGPRSGRPSVSYLTVWQTSEPLQ